MSDSKPPPSAAELVLSLGNRIQREIPAGTRLASERSLALEYGVSRPVVREALRALQERGLVEIRPSRGVFVRAPSSFDLAPLFRSVAHDRGATARDLIEVRAMLESLSAARAAEYATTADVEHLEQLVRSVEATTDLLERARLDVAFHALVARASRNPVIEVMFGSIAPLIFDQMIRSHGDPAVTQEGTPMHRQVLAAIGARDPELASSIMRRHIELAMDLYGGDLDIPLDTLAKSSGRGAFSAADLDDVVESLTRELSEGATLRH